MNSIGKYISDAYNRFRGEFQGRANKGTMDRKTMKIMADLIQRTNALTRKDIKKWRNAWQQAIDADHPFRYELLMIYQDIMIDNHLSGAISNRKNKVLGTPFVMVDKEGEGDSDMTALLEKPWFRGVDVGDGLSGGFMSLALDAIFFGHSLIQFDKWKTGNERVNPFEFKDVELVPREHVLPEYGLLLQEVHHAFGKNGWEYREAPLSNWCIEVGHPKALGLLLKAAPEAISKKNVKMFWDEFAEIFGMPIRVGKTTSRHPDDRAKMEEMLAQMGSAAWGLFEEGTDIEIVETSKTDAYKVYDSRIDKANSEMSKLILGQTMTMDNGSSRSQSEVHERVSEVLWKADLIFLQDEINKKLIPFLELHGYPMQGLAFKWDVPEEITALDLETLQFVIDNFELGQEFVDQIQKRFRIPLERLKQRIEPKELPEPPKKKGDIDSRFLDLHKEIEGYYGDTHHHNEFTADKFEDLEPSVQKIIRQMYDKEDIGDIPHSLYLEISNILQEGAEWNPPDSVDYDTPDNIQLNYIRSNVHAFSAAKTSVQLEEMRSFLTDDDGQLRPFGEFRKDALKVHQTYNINWLRTEYNTAVASSQMASQWLRYQEDKDTLPNLEYNTVGDDRVRPSHQELDGIIRPIDDDIWSRIYPPNGHGCRCDVSATDEGETEESAANQLSKAAVIPPYFRQNVGKSGKIFGLQHPYFADAKLNPSKMKAVQTYGMKPITIIMADPSKLPNRPEITVEEGKGIDTFGIIIKTKNTLDRDIVENADEIFGDGDDNTYIRYFQEGVEKVKVSKTESNSYSPAKESDRVGILLHRK